MERLEPLWRAYEQFEMAGSNKLLARRSIEEQRGRFSSARAAFSERKRLLGPLTDGSLALPPGVQYAPSCQDQKQTFWTYSCMSAV